MSLPAYNGQPYDYAKRRQELLQELQDKSLDALRKLGAVPMTSGVTRPIELPTSGQALLNNLSFEIVRGNLSEGPRFMDRHSTDATSTYRQTRWNTIVGFEGVRDYAYDDATGRRVNGPAKGHVTVGVGFNMDRTNARDAWNQVFGNSVSFDDVRSGKTNLTSDQIRALFDHDMLYYEGIVDKASSGRALSENQRLALLSLAYNNPKSVSDMAPLLQSGNDAAVATMIMHGTGASGVNSHRRYLEAQMFSGAADAGKYTPDYPTYQSSIGEPSSADRYMPGHVAPEITQSLIARSTHGADSITGMSPVLQGRIASMFEAAPADIKQGLGIYSGFRSTGQQAQLYQEALRKYGSPEIARMWVAPPGHSNHNHGMAADLSYNGVSLSSAPPRVVQWLHQNAGRFGLKFPLANENWHVEPVETRGGPKFAGL